MTIVGLMKHGSASNVPPAVLIDGALNASQLTEVIKARDADGMTFLMHACTRRSACPDITSLEPAQHRLYRAPGVVQATYDANEKPPKRGLSRTRLSPNADKRAPVTKESGRGSPQRYHHMKRSGSDDSPRRREAKEADRANAKFGGVAPSRARSEDSEAASGGNGRVEDGTLSTERDDGNENTEYRMYLPAALDPGVPVVKAAVVLLQQCLWKDEVRRGSQRNRRVNSRPCSLMS